MAVRVRLTRVGNKKNPIWRVVVADGRSPRDGRFIEAIGHYNPQTHPSSIVIDDERLQHWLALGAQPTNTVKKLMRAKDNPQVAAAGPEIATDDVAAEETAPEAEAPPESAPETPPALAPEEPAEAQAAGGVEDESGSGDKPA